MTEPVLVLRFIEKRSAHPFFVQGASGKKYGSTTFDASMAAHVFRMPLSEYMKAAVDLVRGFDRPLCKFIVADIKLPDTGGEIAALTAERDDLRERLLAYEPPPKPRDEWTHRDWIAFAKTLGMPRAQILARNGNKAAYRAVVEAYEASLTQGESGATPSPENAHAAQTA